MKSLMHRRSCMRHHNCWQAMPISQPAAKFKSPLPDAASGALSEINDIGLTAITRTVGESPGGILPSSRRRLPTELIWRALNAFVRWHQVVPVIKGTRNSSGF